MEISSHASRASVYAVMISTSASHSVCTMASIHANISSVMLICPPPICKKVERPGFASPSIRVLGPKAESSDSVWDQAFDSMPETWAIGGSRGCVVRGC